MPARRRGDIMQRKLKRTEGVVALGFHQQSNRRIKMHTLAMGAAWGLLAMLAIRNSAQEPQYDLLIVGGHILDGSGSPWYAGSVAIKDGVIADIGRLKGATARQTID